MIPGYIWFSCFMHSPGQRQCLMYVDPPDLIISSRTLPGGLEGVFSRETAFVAQLLQQEDTGSSHTVLRRQFVAGQCPL